MNLKKTFISLLCFPFVFLNHPATAGDLAKDSRHIDTLIEKNYQKYEVSPTKMCPDHIFLRRSTLNIIGRIPSYEEARSFLNSKSTNKRQEWIEYLIHHPGYNHNEFNYWADQLRLKNAKRSIRGVGNNEYGDWLMTSIKNNKPYDQFVRELLNSDGRAEKNGAVGFYLRDQNQILDTVATMSQVFLGAQIFCAQCHDHPFEDITQKQYYEFAAHFGDVEVGSNFMRKFFNNKNKKKGKKNKKNQDMSEMMEAAKNFRQSDLDQKEKNQLRNFIRDMSFNVYDKDNKGLRLPKNYQYDNGKPGQKVQAKLLNGQKIAKSDSESLRSSFANWLTSSENDRFKKTICNRLWKRAMGYGLFEPIDDLNEDTRIRHPDVLDFLCQKLVDYKYDMRKMQQLIYSTNTYQLSVGKEEITRRNAYMQSAHLQRMSAAQIWDSALVIAFDDADRITHRLSSQNYPKFEQVKNVLMDPKTNENDYKALLTRLKANGMSDMMMQMKKQNSQPKKEKLSSQERKKLKRQQKQLKNMAKFRSAFLIRSSEVPVGRKNDHFLDVFGRSDRERVESGTTDPSLQQALALMNGKVHRFLTNPMSTLTQNVQKSIGVEDKIDTVYLSILSRKPVEVEKLNWTHRIKQNRVQGYQDLVWCLLNSKEFLFII